MNERKLYAVLAGAAACAVLGTFLVGVPVFLVRLVGNPLPSALPTWSSVVSAVESGVVPPGVAIGVVAVVVWIWWSQVALAFAVEAVAASRGRMAQALPLNAFGMQPLVVRLVAIMLTAASTLGLLTQPVVAASPSFAGIAVPGTAAEPVRAGAGEIAVAPSASGAPGPESLGAPSPAVAPAAPPPPILAPPPGASTTPSVPRMPESAPESTAPILAPPVDRTASSVQGSPPVSSAPMHEVAPATLGTPLESSPLAHRLLAEVLPVERVSGAPLRPSVALPIPVADPAAGDESPGAVQPLNAPAAAGARASNAVTSPDTPPVPDVSGEPGTGARSEPSIADGDPVADADRLSDERGEAAEIGTSGWVVVKPGDSLWLLAEKHLGDALRWEDIFDLNTGPLPGGGTLRDPNLIHPGWRLRLPTPAPQVSSGPAGGMHDYSGDPNSSPQHSSG